MSWLKRVLFGDPRARAAREGNIAKMQELLDQGMDINEATHMSDPALFHAASVGQVEMVDFLLKNGAEADGYTNSYHHTPLMQAAHYGHTKVVKLLMENGANVKACNINGKTPLDFALMPVEYSDYPVRVEDKESSAELIRQAGGAYPLKTSIDRKRGRKDGKTTTLEPKNGYQK
jgi:hypothetical protein